jgi:NAD-dependent deacetylase
MEKLIDQAADILISSEFTIALTGAGISVDSGIPDFRSAGGLWSRFDPAEYATIAAFRANPGKVWKMVREMGELIDQAQPNMAHTGLGELENMGYLHHIITQNVDNLHQAGGSKNVIEYHGNASTLSCLVCGKCDCNEVLKPDVVFFGEPIPEEARSQSFRIASQAQALMVIATSAIVSPANTIPGIAKQNGAKIIEINKEKTHLTGSVTDIFLQGNAGKTISALLAAVKAKKGDKVFP